MIKYAVTRLLWMIPIMLGVIVIVFSISYFSPGDPVLLMLGNDLTEEQYATKAAEFGLDKPYFVQLGTYIWNVMTRFDFGKSFSTRIPISYMFAERIPVSFKLSILSIIVMVGAGVPLGLISALKQYSALDVTLTSFSLFMAAIPGYVLALLCMLLFGVTLRWLPITGIDSWKNWILPVFCSAGMGIAVFTRMARTTMLEVIKQDYIRTARAKGQKERIVVTRHALKNCLIPLVTILGAQVSRMFSGSVIIETLFAFPGIGQYLREGIMGRDYPVINGCVFMISLLVCSVNLLVDIAYAFIDPRIKAQFVSVKRKKKAVAAILGSQEDVA